MSKKVVVGISLILLFLIHPLQAKEGMWLPLSLHGALESDMQAMGMKLSAEDIYNINQSSLKDAIVNFGGCTGSMISPNGLLLTNHHCGYSVIQSHSTVENDLLTNGFWARNQQEELRTDLRVYFIKEIRDVTDIILSGLSQEITDLERESIIHQRIDSLSKQFVKGTHYEAQIKSFFYGANYYLFLTETFTDVRLVGAPPSSIGKFGGNTDNWMWPRHTGDFALFRIYASPDGKPAGYNKRNVPYQPDHYLPVNISGVQPGDFTMIFGFPGATTQYLVSPAVDQLVNKINPHRINIRKQKLEILDAAMSENDTIRLQYAAKHARVSNYYKKWIGENMGLQNFNAIEKKKAGEKAFAKWINEDAERKERYGELLPSFYDLYAKQETPELVYSYLREAVYGVDILILASRLRGLADTEGSKKWSPADVKSVRSYLEGFFKNYDEETDKQLFIRLIGLYIRNLPADYIPTDLLTVKNDNANLKDIANRLYAQSIISDEEKIRDLLSSFNKKKAAQLAQDPFISLQRQFFMVEAVKVAPILHLTEDLLTPLYRSYVEALRTMHADSVFYPDANRTMRIAYGKMEGSAPRDGIKYLPYTTLGGVIQKEDAGNPEFYVPQKLKELYEAKDYGDYGVNDTIYVCFLSSNHTTGGNSGSPVIDANGALIGLNFDRTWESTMSDVMYDPAICRNISVDVRYILFIIDKYAEADYLIDEMKLVTRETQSEFFTN